MPWSGQSMYCKWVTSLDCRRGTYEGRGWTNSKYHDDYIATHETYKERMGNVLPLHWGCALIGILCWWQWTSFPQRAWRFDTGEKCGYAFQMCLLTLQLPGNSSLTWTMEMALYLMHISSAHTEVAISVYCVCTLAKAAFVKCNIQRWQPQYVQTRCGLIYNAISIVHVRLGFNLYLVLCILFPALWCLTIYHVMFSPSTI